MSTRADRPRLPRAPAARENRGIGGPGASPWDSATFSFEDSAATLSRRFRDRPSRRGSRVRTCAAGKRNQRARHRGCDGWRGSLLAMCLLVRPVLGRQTVPAAHSMGARSTPNRIRTCGTYGRRYCNRSAPTAAALERPKGTLYVIPICHKDLESCERFRTPLGRKHQTTTRIFGVFGLSPMKSIRVEIISHVGSGSSIPSPPQPAAGDTATTLYFRTQTFYTGSFGSAVGLKSLAFSPEQQAHLSHDSLTTPGAELPKELTLLDEKQRRKRCRLKNRGPARHSLARSPPKTRISSTRSLRRQRCIRLH